jgi:hypothetical protein
MKKLFLCAVAVLALALPASATAATAVPGHTGSRVDADENGYPDAGVKVTGHYTSLYAEDATGDYYWDLGDGRVYTKGVSSIEELDEGTLTVCHYVNNYRATFENDPYMDSGWITNNIRCTGAEPGVYKYLIVNESDPRYRGNPQFAIWGNWEYHALTESGAGNLVGPRNHVA